MGTRTASILFIYVSPAPTETWHTEGVQKHLLVTILLPLWELLSQLIPQPQPREKQGGHEGAQEGEDFCSCCLGGTLSGPVVQGSPK